MTDSDFKDITDGCPSGNGVFDEMMRSVKAHLKEEYDSQRIRGSEYTQVYLQSLQAAMTQSIQWQLGADIAKKQAELIEAQVEGQRKQNDILLEQLAQTIAQTELIRVQTANAIEEGKIIPHQKELVEEQVVQAGLQSQMITQQTLTEEENTKTAKYNVDEMLPAQKVIYDQKLITEQAQTQNTSVKGNIEGIVGAQRNLYNKQIDGYDRDAEQKAVRTLTDTYGVALSSDVTNIPSAIENQNVSSALTSLLNNAGL